MKLTTDFLWYLVCPFVVRALPLGVAGRTLWPLLMAIFANPKDRLRLKTGILSVLFGFSLHHVSIQQAKWKDLPDSVLVHVKAVTDVTLVVDDEKELKAHKKSD